MTSTIKVFKYEDSYTTPGNTFNNGFIEMVRRVKDGSYPGVISNEITQETGKLAIFTIEFESTKHADFFRAFEG